VQAAAVRAGKVVGEARLVTPRTGGDDLIGTLARAVDEALADAGGGRDGLGAVGVGSPGQVDRATGTVSRSSNVPGLLDPFPLGPRLSDALGGVAVRVDNDARVFAVGEHNRGAGRPYRDFLAVAVGTGVGGGLVLGGRLREGRGAAGEIGHTVVKDGGRTCPCGRTGCLEAYAGRASIEATARRRQQDGRKTKLFKIMEDKGRPRVTSGVIAKALEEGDEVTIELIDQAVWALGVALASAQNLLDLEAFVIGGGLGDRLGAPFVKHVADAMEPHLFATHRPDVLPSALGDLSGAVGAAVLAGG